ncbi:MAG TPA: serine--tRNA ligase [Phycisphaerae bacterium]|jgi:seryl-tRNA synthetase|nr:serine--tRNA ligase [Phycisphaerae bacterium]HOB75776.1 serine--tRNA ligase [Phycisphaerae bacterium]HOJ55592.1 serine--tRNA ligase [Phycisphaerae bacterium]HOL27712.1 serine--tRNA ligase [Phycisphaerae bacterium]HPP21906.1 serine--tRNA ligase [Phycisphaerae bacterium]
MIDIKLIRQDPQRFKDAALAKRIHTDIDAICALDDRRRAIQRELDLLKHQQNEISGQIALYKNPKSKWYQQALASGRKEDELKAEGQKLIDQVAELKARTKDLDAAFKQVNDELTAALLTVPQPADPEVPVGKDESENVELRRVGEPPKFDFEPKDHVTLMTALNMLDIERGVKLAGTRNYLLKGDGAALHHAVLRLALDLMVERGFTQMVVPVLVRDEMMVGTGYYPGGEEQAYRCERDAMSLIGTAEVPLTAYHRDEILTEDELPKKYVALSTCFRREAGAAGKDTYGLYRIHLFDKVEQVIICANDEQLSKQFHAEILQNAEDVLARLELPYRVVNVCTGDLGQGQVQKFDIETWMPSRGGYGETHSASRFYEYQARRLMLRYRDGAKNIKYCHTLNNTVIASPRILIPLVENHQNPDGTIRIPPALRPYLGGRDVLGGK